MYSLRDTTGSTSGHSYGKRAVYTVLKLYKSSRAPYWNEMEWNGMCSSDLSATAAGECATLTCLRWNVM